MCYFIAAVLCGGCKKSQQPAKIAPGSPAPAPLQQAGSPQPKIEACSLVTKEDVAAIQRATITETKSSAGWYGNLLMSQCYYSAKEPNASVSLAVIQPGSRSANSNSREYWDQIFGSSAQQSDHGREDREKAEKRFGEAGKVQEEKEALPQKIDGVGEQAYWSGNRFGGALYVLQKDIIVRVSVGGPENAETKIAKSKAIAQKALLRLRSES